MTSLSGECVTSFIHLTFCLKILIAEKRLCLCRSIIFQTNPTNYKERHVVKEKFDVKTFNVSFLIKFDVILTKK